MVFQKMPLQAVDAGKLYVARKHTGCNNRHRFGFRILLSFDCISPEAHGIEVFECDSPRIDIAMTAGARSLLAMNGQLFANRELMKFGIRCFQRRNVRRRRCWRVAKQSIALKTCEAKRRGGLDENRRLLS